MNQCQINIKHSRTKHVHTFAEVGAVGEAINVCPHTIDANPEGEGQGGYDDKAGRDARLT